MKTATTEDIYVIRAMEKYGGGFVKALAIAARVADDSNLTRIKQAWPDYWEKYTQLAMVGRCPRCGSDSIGEHHHGGTFATPECNYKECELCCHQWDHS